MLEKPSRTMEGCRTLVTGAGSGIGKATAVAFARAGAAVCLLDRSGGELSAVFEGVGGERQGHVMAVADVASEREMVAAYRGLAAAGWDGLDAVVANAGINGVWAPLDQLAADEWDETLAVNLRGTFLTVKLALPYLRKRGGSVIIVASVNGTRVFSNSGATAYACSKAGQVAFAKMIALELARDRIRVNVVCPGAIDTPIHATTERRETEDLHLPVEFPEGDVPLTEGAPGLATDVASVIEFLATAGSRHISGSEIYVDGAQSLLQG